MRTNIDIDDALMDKALQAGPFKTKKEAVEAGLELLARQAAYREILKWRGKLKWEGDDAIDWTVPVADSPESTVPPAAVPRTQTKVTPKLTSKANPKANPKATPNATPKAIGRARR